MIRAPEPQDAAAILQIIREHGLPTQWTWPEGKHGLVVGEPVKAFCILSETIYGLVVEELWEEQSREGFHALTLLSREIEAIAGRLRARRGAPLACGGIVQLSRPKHIAALKKRGYTTVAVILEKVFE